MEILNFKKGGYNTTVNGNPMYKRKDGKVVKRGLWSNVYLSKMNEGGNVLSPEKLCYDENNNIVECPVGIRPGTIIDSNSLGSLGSLGRSQDFSYNPKPNPFTDPRSPLQYNPIKDTQIGMLKTSDLFPGMNKPGLLSPSNVNPVDFHPNETAQDRSVRLHMPSALQASQDKVRDDLKKYQEEEARKLREANSLLGKRKFGTLDRTAIAGFGALTSLGLGLSKRYDERRNQRGDIYSQLTANQGASQGVNYGYSKYGGYLKRFKEGGFSKQIDEEFLDLIGDISEDDLIDENSIEESNFTERVDAEKLEIEKQILQEKEEAEINKKRYDIRSNRRNMINSMVGQRKNYSTKYDNNNSPTDENNSFDPEPKASYVQAPADISKIRKQFANAENSGNTDFSKDHDGKPGGAFGPYGWMDSGANNSHFKDYFLKNIGGLKTRYKTYENYIRNAKANNEETAYIEKVYIDELKRRNGSNLGKMAAYNLYGGLGQDLYDKGSINNSNVIGKNASIATYINRMGIKKEGGIINNDIEYEISPAEALMLRRQGITFKIL